MKFSKLSTPTLKELFIERIENSILSGKLEIGEPLPSERELAESLGVSRAVVNAGINEMATKGFLEVRPRVGAYVADYRRRGNMDTLLSMMKYNGGRLRKDDIKSILEIKRVLDQLALDHLIPKITDEEIGLLEARRDALAAATTAEDAALATFDFYHEMVLLSGNTLIPMIYSSFKMPVLILWERYNRKYNDRLLHSINTLMEAIAKRNLAAAKQHVEDTLDSAISGGTDVYVD